MAILPFDAAQLLVIVENQLNKTLLVVGASGRRLTLE
jgi:hypothetical protein